MTVIDDDQRTRRGRDGIIGRAFGKPSGCSQATKTMFSGSGLLRSLRTAATGRKLGVISDARYRFDSGVDPLPQVAPRLPRR